MVPLIAKFESHAGRVCMGFYNANYAGWGPKL